MEATVSIVKTMSVRRMWLRLRSACWYMGIPVMPVATLFSRLNYFSRNSAETLYRRVAEWQSPGCSGIRLGRNLR
jgi:hypothetical protein